MALHLGEIVKTVIFIIAGVAIVLLLINLFAPGRSGDYESESVREAFIPGAYHVNLQLSTGSIEIEVVVNENSIVSIGFVDLAEDQQVFYPLFKPTMDIIRDSVLENQNLAVSIPEDRLITGQVLLSAIDEALSLAAAD